MTNCIWRGLVGAALLIAGQSAPANSFYHSSQAVTHSVNAIGYSAVGSVQLVSGVLAIPLGVSAGIGHVSGHLSDDLWEAANAPIGEPLPITDEVITIGPLPAEALKDGEEQEP